MMSPLNDELLWDRWRRNAERWPEREAVVVWKAGGAPHRWRWGAVLEEAERFGRDLVEAGVVAGDVCALVLRHDPMFYPLYMGIESMGAIPAVLAYPNNRLHPQKFRDGLMGMAAHSGLDWILTEESLRPMVEPLLRTPASTVRGLLCPLSARHRAEVSTETQRARAGGFSAESPCLLQHSSGTTGLQKAVMLSHRAVLTHVDSYARAIALSESDRIVSWLPLYHDMGLIAGFHLPLAMAVTAIHLDPFEWIAAPGMLLDVLSKERGTLSWLPNFAFSFMAQRTRDDDLEGAMLGHVRSLINCSEPVRADSQDAFFQRFHGRGISRRCLAACYAMAETTFAVTQTEPGREAIRLTVDRDALARGEAVEVMDAEGEGIGRTCVSSGRPIEGCAVRVVDDEGNLLPEGRVGELQIASQYLFDGYRGQSEKTAAVLRDGWYLSGDLGFIRDQECYVVGRKKDLIIVAGKNLVPEDIEDVLLAVPGVIPGRVVAFGLEDNGAGTEMVAVVLETEVTGLQERKDLRLNVIRRAMEIDVTVSRVYLAPPRWLIKSSAGKPARAANCARAVAELKPF